MRRALALLVLIAAPSSAVSRDEESLQRVTLDAHNRARADFGVAPVRWSAELETAALAHARSMAASGIYGHDRTPGRRKSQGENIWRGKRGAFPYETMVGTMIAERRLFRPGAYPHNSSTGDWQAVSHYTQIVWPATTEIGCALESSATMDYFVCRYAPTGNKDGFVLAIGGAPVAELAQRGR